MHQVISMQDSNKNWRDKSLFFALGVLSLAVVGLLLGAASDYQNTSPNYGRFQVSSFATRLGNESGVVGAFVVDTVSGETRTAYLRTYGDPPNSTAVKNDLKKPFISIQ